jgi:hypothetical protein
MNAMNKKWLTILVIILLGGMIYFLRQVNQGTFERADKTTGVNRDRGFDRRTSFLKYSKHARCRMDCRSITESEVEDIMKKGKINYKKSDISNSRCPRYAIEGMTSDDQEVRIVFAQCNKSTTVVTVIDLEKEWLCDCK